MFLVLVCRVGILQIDRGITASSLLRRGGRDSKRSARRDAEASGLATGGEPADPRSGRRIGRAVVRAHRQIGQIDRHAVAGRGFQRAVVGLSATPEMP
jgi:hypothetical protein